MRFQMTDDSGFLGLADPDLYEGFVDADWELPQLNQRFLEQMKARRLLLWGTGMEHEWSVEVSTQPTMVLTGLREFVAPIRVSQGRLFLLNYEILTMAAQYPQQTLIHQAVMCESASLPAGDYLCRVVQCSQAGGPEPHFLLELTPDEGGSQPLSAIPWR
jgi:hypothetical protein